MRSGAEAIEKPAKLMGAAIAPRLMERLLNDAGDDPDRLPVLQHALMRTWEEARGASPIDLEHYDLAGTMEHALDRHARKVYEDLVEADRPVAKRIFQRLTERRSGARDTRRPAKVGELRAVTGAALEVVKRICLHFSKERRTFLNVADRSVGEDLPGRQEVTDDSLIDVTHESLLHLWSDLNQWIDEEEDWGRQYLALAEQVRRAPNELLAEGPLERAIAWQTELQKGLPETGRETALDAWAERYPLPGKSGPKVGYADVARLIDRSVQRAGEDRARRQQELEDQIREKHRRHKTRNVAVVAVVVALAMIGLSWWALEQRHRAVGAAAESTGIAKENKRIAGENQRTAAANRAEADVALKAKAAAVASDEVAEQQRAIAEKQQRIASAGALAWKSLGSLSTAPWSAMQDALAAVEATTREEGPQSQAVDALEQSVQDSRLQWVVPASSPGFFQAASFSTDGKLVGISRFGSGIQVVQLPSGNEVWSNGSGDVGFLNATAFSPDGRYFGVTKDDVSAYELPAFRLAYVSPKGDLKHPREYAAALDLSSDGQMSILRKSSVDVVKLSDGTITSLPISGATSLRFSPDKRYLYFTRGAPDQISIVKWDLGTGTAAATSHLPSFVGLPDPRLRINAHGNLIAFSGAFETRLLSAADFSIVANVNGGVWEFSSDDSMGAASSGDAVQIFDGRGEKLLLQLGTTAQDVHFAASGRLITVGLDGGMRGWDINPQSDYRSLHLQSGYKTTLVLLDQGRRVAGITSNYKPALWDIETGRLTKSSLPNLAVTLGAFNAIDEAGTTLATVDYLRNVAYSEGQTSQKWQPPGLDYQARVAALGFNGEGKLIAAWTDSKNPGFNVWDVRAKRQIAAVTESADQVWIGSGNEQYAYRTNGRIVFRRGNVIERTVQMNASMLKFERSRARVALAAGSDVRVVDLRSGAETRLQYGGKNSFNSFDFSPDGKSLAGGAQDGRLLVWELNSHSAPRVFSGQAFAIQQVEFMPDSNKVTTLATDGTVRVFWLDLNQLKAHARKLLAEWWR